MERTQDERRAATARTRFDGIIRILEAAEF